MEREIAPRITVDPQKCGGRPCVRGMRIRVSDVIDLMAHGLSVSEVLEELPDLEQKDVTACLKFASKLTTLRSSIPDTALLSEAALSDWNRPEEDEAWAHLQPDRRRRLTTTKDDIHKVVEQLPNSQFNAAIQYLRYLRDFSDPVMGNLPEDTEYDDDLSPEDIAAIQEGLEDIRAGKLTPIEDVRKELGL